jgi:hypothetical protein
MCNVNGYENLAIIQHQDTLHYAIIQKHGYWPRVYRFELRNYVYKQHITSTTSRM